MKITSATLFLLLLLLATATKPSTVAAAEAPAPVRDISGNILRSGTDYYILSVVRGAGGGGLTLTDAGNNSCPRYVAQEPLDVLDGLPLTFSPVNPKKGVIRESTDLNFKFSASTICVQSTVWKLYYDESSGERFVRTGGVEGNPGPETIDNWFKIEKFADHDFYKLVFCPTVCDYCKVLCRDVGIYIEDHTRFLALSDVPFLVRFKKA